MARTKQPHPLLDQARAQLRQIAPELDAVPLHLRQLDGPPGAPRFLVTAERCCAAHCPQGVPAAVFAAGGCTVHCCPLRCAVQLLFSREGQLMEANRNGIHWF